MKKNIFRYLGVAALGIVLVVGFQNCSGVGDGGSGGGSGDGGSTATGVEQPNPNQCPLTSNSRPSISALNPGNLTFGIGQGLDAGTQGPTQVAVSYSSGDDYSAIVDLDCDVIDNAGLNVTCNNPNEILATGTTNIGIAAANDAECASGTVTVRVTVQDAIVNTNGAPINACNGLQRTSTVSTLTINVQNRCLATQRVNAPTQYANAQLGADTATDGNWSVAVAPRDDGAENNGGAAYVMQRAGNTWNIVQTLFPSNLAAGDEISSVALSGNLLAMGSFSANGNLGRVWVFENNNGNWQEIQILTPPNGVTAFSNFGVALAISNGRVAVGASGANAGDGLIAGAVYVYSGPALNAVSTLRPSGTNLPYGMFGSSLAFSGNTLAVGAPYILAGNNTREESVYIFDFAGATPSFVQRIANTVNSLDFFGFSVALDGNNLLIGHPNWLDRQGRATLHVRNGLFPATPTQEYTLADPNDNDDDAFGYDVAIRGNRVLASAPEKAEGDAKVGAVYLFGTANNNQLFKILSGPDDRDNGDVFGHSISVTSDGWLISGALNDQIVNPANAGAVYFVDLP